ncbi:hypothetical protein F5880DRAFT_715897 [Lentinula raphanica]|nr:hypothetical protein F5880DRAFT_715897 [Lentinula raphanica]
MGVRTSRIRGKYLLYKALLFFKISLSIPVLLPRVTLQEGGLDMRRDTKKMIDRAYMLLSVGFPLPGTHWTLANSSPELYPPTRKINTSFVSAAE